MQWMREEMWAWKSYNALEQRQESNGDAMTQASMSGYFVMSACVSLTQEKINEKHSITDAYIFLRIVYWEKRIYLLISTEVKIQWVPESHPLEVILVHVHLHLGVNDQEPVVLAGDGLPAEPQLLRLRGGVPVFHKVAPP